MEISFLWSNVVTGVFTLAAGPLFSYLMAKAIAKREAKTVKASLLAEINSLVKLMKDRDYLGALQSGARGQHETLTIRIPDENFQVYRVNLQKLGLLESEFAADVVRFYLLLTSLKQDVIEGGVLNDSEVDAKQRLKHFADDAILLNEAFAIGDSLKER